MNREEKATITKSKIIKTAYNLFSQKGYDSSTMQDIMNDAQLSKGAIYHHFKSKEEILAYMTQQAEAEISNFLHQLVSNNSLTTEEKISHIINYFFNNENQNLLIRNNWVEKIPFALLETVRNTNTCISTYIAKIIKQGITNKEFTCTYPQELAEAFSLLIDVWLDPIIFKRNYNEICSRIDFISELLIKFNAPLLNDKNLTEIKTMYKKYCQ